MTVEKNDVVDLKWLRDGKEDPHPRYVDYKREDLSGAHLLSDDELAFQISMMSTISDEQDMKLMLNSHRNGGDYISKGILVEVAKDRIRWLSRRVAVLEGRYPGKEAPKQETVSQLPKHKDAYIEAMNKARLERQIPLLLAFLGLDTNSTIDDVRASLTKFGLLHIDVLRVLIAIGSSLEKEYEKRWHFYVHLVKDFLKAGLYVPYWDDEYTVDQKLAKQSKPSLFIRKSRYFNTGEPYFIRSYIQINPASDLGA